MNGCGPFRVAFAPSFERDFAKLIERHYRRISDEELHQTLQIIFGELEASPRGNPPKYKPEKWPKKAHQPPWEFWKCRFSMPGLKGKAQKGRIMYIIHPEEHLVILVYFYTHSEFAKYPKDRELRQRLQEGIEHLDHLPNTPPPETSSPEPEAESEDDTSGAQHKRKHVGVFRVFKQFLGNAGKFKAILAIPPR